MDIAEPVLVCKRCGKEIRPRPRESIMWDWEHSETGKVFCYTILEKPECADLAEPKED